jgi:Flp pilus assembly protein TadG
MLARKNGIFATAGTCIVFLRDTAGDALLEFAFVLPLMLMTLTGIFAFAMAYNNDIMLTQAVGSGGQYLQLIRTSTTDPCNDTMTALKNAAPNLSASNISLTVTINGTTPTQTGNSCSGSQSLLSAGVPVTVKATYPCKLPTYGITFPSCNLSAQVTEYEY